MKELGKIFDKYVIGRVQHLLTVRFLNPDNSNSDSESDSEFYLLVPVANNNNQYLPLKRRQVLHDADRLIRELGIPRSTTALLIGIMDFLF
jgi:hypothetical protein